MTFSRLSALTLALLAATAVVGTALAQSPRNPLDRSNPNSGKQDPKLKGNPVPPTVTPLDKVPLAAVRLPPGFKAEVWHHGMPGARTMAMGPKGTMFVGSRAIGRVYAITDKGGKREHKTILQGLTQPNGLAFKDSDLFVFAINKVLRYPNIEASLDKLPEPEDLTEKFRLPADTQHGWKYVKFGPDGMLYVPVGANCNICELNPATHGHLRRYDPKDWSHTIVARGIRNTVGFAWHPVTKELWFTDNGRDWAGDEGPEDELNRLPKGQEGAHFGYPYCHAEGIPDPDVRVPNACRSVITAAAKMGPHSAALGMIFYTGSMFPKAYRNAMFIARHGSWNRSKRFGYDVVVARPTAGGKARVEPFLTGWLDEPGNKYLARPTDVFQLADGSILVSEEHTGAIIRISYGEQKTAGR